MNVKKQIGYWYGVPSMSASGQSVFVAIVKHEAIRTDVTKLCCARYKKYPAVR
jgi:hypothetical protein